ncbi:hypothetical protein [Halobiforma nitratireducens]|uniref:hypothetical protein n=1 Tax=Halobiforma nitratireducens TaxID=130048 RepID=UPI0019552A34|nr:hypothetical protein [Halobiforma nitratireducens]
MSPTDDTGDAVVALESIRSDERVVWTSRTSRRSRRCRTLEGEEAMNSRQGRTDFE